MKAPPVRRSRLARTVKAADNYLELHSANRTYMLRETMGQFEAKLDPRKFARIHRPTLVNLDRVRELQPLFNGDQAVVLNDGTRLMVSRTYRDRLLSLLR